MEAKHNVFYISTLRRYVIKLLVVMELYELHIEEYTTYGVKPRTIIGCNTKVTQCTSIYMVKV